ncbi:hypothetical protein CH352_17050 [Leptospira hartskeerlii]|uniref:Uncharacterized protein n=1 Tax=Leptospira hartskeerlii TaxID=2023177 RepID=A0A2M9XIR8_9LEPT|nr:hypothetical protein [Leptospira hartskeerlii]PJZ27575.1 hypothetical protein CH357_02895 [Leptospira hartskeerlii]PJZ32391.1 hypothetical protein CH352_17050 [Leptospira hartskeerlii]
MTKTSFLKNTFRLLPKFYLELFDSDQVFLAAVQIIGKRILRFRIDSRASYKKGDGVYGRLYGLRSSFFIPISGIIRDRKEIKPGHYSQLCELELESDEDIE